MALRALPDGYVDFQRGGVRLLARRDVAEALCAAGALDGVPAEQWGTRAADSVGGRRPLLAVAVPGVPGTLLVKRLARGGLLGAVLGGRYLADRAFAEILAVATLRARGVPAPPILAARLTRAGRLAPGVRVELVVPRFDGAVDLARFLLLCRPPRERTRVLAAAGRALAHLHAAGAVHRDLNAANLLVLEDGSVQVIDLGARVAPATPAAVHASLARLLRSCVKWRLLERGAERTDLVRLLRGLDAPRWKEHARAVLAALARALPWHELGWRLFGRRVPV